MSMMNLTFSVRSHLALISAASHFLNPYNFEAGFKPLYQNILRDILDKYGHTRAAGAFTEIDLYLDTKESVANADVEFTMVRDPTIVRACRPDFAIGYYGISLTPGPETFLQRMIRRSSRLAGKGDKAKDVGKDVKKGKRVKKGKDGPPLKLKVEHVFLAVIGELKRAPSRTLVNFSDGVPINAQGQKALDHQISLAQRQVTRQGALYLKTEAGRIQGRVLLLAGAGPETTYTMMYCDEGEHGDVQQWSLIQQLVDLQNEDDEAAARDVLSPEPARALYDHKHHLWAQTWETSGHVASQEFEDMLERYLADFELWMREAYPNSFGVGME